MVAGRMMGDYASKSALQQELADITKERDARIEEFASGREQRGYEHQERLQGQSFSHTENMQASQQDFQAAENFLSREQHSSDSSLNRASAEAIAKLGRDTQVQIAQMHGTVQVDKEGKIQWIGAGGKVVDTGLMSQKDLPPSAKVAADILRDQLKALDKQEAEGTGNPTVIQQQRTQVNGQLLAVLTGDLNKAFGSSGGGRGAPAAGTVVDGYKFLGGNPNDRSRWEKSGGEGGGGLLHASAPLADYPPGSPEYDAEHKPEGLVQRKQRQIREKADRERSMKEDYGDAGY